jgi:endo-1,4-beta-xylanase
MKKNFKISYAFLISLAFIVLMISCTNTPKKTEKLTLKDAYKDYFLIGAAINRFELSGKDSATLKIVKEQFNSISPENVLKWMNVHPKKDSFNFKPADEYVDFGLANHMFIIGHTLLWHQQVPKWIFVDDKGNDVSRDTLLKRLHDHIATVVGRYKGKINGWDVVNEALTEDGQMRQTKWLKIIGDDYIEKAFEYAHEADPNAELYYNDYNIEMPAKRAGAIKIIKNLQSKGIKIDGVGIQAHWHMDVPSLAVIDSAIAQFSALGVKVMLTEMDINVLPRPENLTGAEVSDRFKLTPESNPYPNGLPDSVQVKFSERYADIFRILCKYKSSVSRVTFWGVSDRMSWLNNWPIPGRTNYPLLFDRNLQPKPVVDSLLNIVAGK